MPDLHLRRRRESTVELGCIGAVGVNWVLFMHAS